MLPSSLRESQRADDSPDRPLSDSPNYNLPIGFALRWKIETQVAFCAEAATSNVTHRSKIIVISSIATNGSLRLIHIHNLFRRRCILWLFVITNPQKSWETKTDTFAIRFHAYGRSVNR